MQERIVPYTPTKEHSVGVGSLPVDDIFVGDRLRSVNAADVKYINEFLVPSIAQRGLIHPIIVTWNQEHNRWELIAGWNRLQAFKLLNYETIPYNTRETMQETEKLRLELEENIRRSDMRWQDKVVGVYKVHLAETQDAAAKCMNWTMEATGHIIGTSAATVSYILPVAKALIANDEEVKKCGGYMEAYKILLRRKEAEAIKLLHERSLSNNPDAPVSNSVPKGVLTKPSPSAAPKKTSGMMSGLVDDPGFEFELAHPAGTKPQPKPMMERKEVPLSRMVINADCVEWMAKVCPPNTFNLIYSDPPFGIEMSNLSSVAGIELVEKSHDVEENLTLLKKFFKPAYRVLKEDSHLILWCDIIHWEKMIAWAREAGFTTQNWPLLWLKPPGESKNDASYKNWPKAHESLIVCHKGQSTLRSARPTNYWICSAKGERGQQLNPFCKPFMISKEIIDATIVPGMKMLDCFAGGGSLTRAAINLGIDVTAIEKDKDQFPLLVESIRATFKEIGGDSVTFV